MRVPPAAGPRSVACPGRCAAVLAASTGPAAARPLSGAASGPGSAARGASAGAFRRFLRGAGACTAGAPAPGSAAAVSPCLRRFCASLLAGPAAAPAALLPGGGAAAGAWFSAASTLSKAAMPSVQSRACFTASACGRGAVVRGCDSGRKRARRTEHSRRQQRTAPTPALSCFLLTLTWDLMPCFLTPCNSQQALSAPPALLQVDEARCARGAAAPAPRPPSSPSLTAGGSRTSASRRPGSAVQRWAHPWCRLQ